MREKLTFDSIRMVTNQLFARRRVLDHSLGACQQTARGIVALGEETRTGRYVCVRYCGDLVIE